MRCQIAAGEITAENDWSFDLGHAATKFGKLK